MFSKASRSKADHTPTAHSIGYARRGCSRGPQGRVATVLRARRVGACETCAGWLISLVEPRGVEPLTS